ncbi:MAG TPA: response regulator [Terriglobales bacterium]
MNRKPLILCADDNAHIVEGWKTLLKLKGYEVLTASNGAEALQAFVAHPVDLAMLDYHMPRMNGDVAATRMKACKPDVPIALLSADTLPVLADLKAVDLFVSKSLPIAGVLEMVDQLLSRRVLFQPLQHWEGGEQAA